MPWILLVWRHKKKRPLSVFFVTSGHSCLYQFFQFLYWSDSPLFSGWLKLHVQINETEPLSFASLCVYQVESETSISELKLSNTTGRLVQLEREVGLLRQNNLEVNRLVETCNMITDQAKLNAEEAQQVFYSSLSFDLTHKTLTTCYYLLLPSQQCLFCLCEGVWRGGER